MLVAALVGLLLLLSLTSTLSALTHPPFSDRPDALIAPIHERTAPAPLGNVPAAIPTPTYAAQVAELINVERSKLRLPPLKEVDMLETSALGHSTRMATANFLSTCDPGPPQTTLVDRMTAAGYIWSAAAENIIVGYSYKTPADAVAGWMANSSNRAQILSLNYREAGAGFYYQADDLANIAVLNSTCITQTTNNGPFYWYWVQDFGSRTSTWPLVVAGEAFQAVTLNVSLFVYTPTAPSQMRFSNDELVWSAWQPFTTTMPWRLTPGNGAKTVYGQVYDGASAYVVSDTIWLNAPPVAVTVAISSAAAVTLTWQHQAANLWYDAYRSTVNPYFTPGGADSVLVGPAIPAPVSGSTVTFVDGTAAPVGTYFYQIQTVAGDGQTTADSNRTGQFVFSLTPGN